MSSLGRRAGQRGDNVLCRGGMGRSKGRRIMYSVGGGMGRR